jgi:hypothetical protein
MASATGPGLSMSSILIFWPEPMPLATKTLPRPVSTSKKLRLSEIEIIRATGISVV